MSYTTRFRYPFAVGTLFLLSATSPLRALSPILTPSPTLTLSIDEPLTDTAMLAAMEAKAAQAEPRERCFLYTELLHEWTEFAGRSLAAGDTEAAATAMQHADNSAVHLKEAIRHDSKRLKNAELLLEHSVHRLSDMLRVSPQEQHEAMQAVLHHVSSVHDDLLAAVFAH